MDSGVPAEDSFFAVHAFASVYGGSGKCGNSTGSGFYGVIVTGHRS